MSEPQNVSEAQRGLRWEVNPSNPSQGFTTSGRETTIRNFGPSRVGIRIDGRRLPDQNVGSETYGLPGGKQVLVEVLLVPGTPGSVGEFSV